jgi:NTE family protein
MKKARLFLDNDLHAFLSKVPLFSTIPREQLPRLAALFEPVFAEKGHIVCTEGEPGDAMYIIKSGSVGVYVTRNSGELLVNYLHRGDFFGEMALLTQRTRTATIKVILDAHLCRLSRHDFEQLLRENPSIGLYLSRHYAHRFAQSSKKALNEPLPTFFAMMASHRGLGKSHFLYSVAYHLTKEANKKVLLVELDPDTAKKISNYGLKHSICPDRELVESFSTRYAEVLLGTWYSHSSGFTVFFVPRVRERRYWEEFEANLPGIMGLLRERFDPVLFNIPQPVGVSGRMALRLCDAVLLLINNNSEALAEVRNKIESLSKVRGLPLEKIKVGVSHLIGLRGVPRDTLRMELNLPETPAVWAHRTESALSDRIDTAKCFPVRGPRAVARELGRIRVGLALGAGGARAWAHLGVLKVLEDEGIHIDMISGSSMGAVVGSIYGRTASARNTKRLTIDQFSTKVQTRRKIFDYTIPVWGIIRGQRALRMIRHALKDADFLDLRIPTFLMAVDILTGEEVILERGNVSEAVRASIAIPGIFTPTYLDGHWLVDGGLLNPMPVDVLIQKGADVVIAVCVERGLHYERGSNERRPSIIGLLSRTVNIVHAQVGKDSARKADIVIYPKVDDFAWDDFHKGRELMQAGVRVCRQHIEEIKKLIAEKTFGV